MDAVAEVAIGGLVPAVVEGDAGAGWVGNGRLGRTCLEPGVEVHDDIAESRRDTAVVAGVQKRAELRDLFAEEGGQEDGARTGEGVLVVAEVLHQPDDLAEVAPREGILRPHPVREPWGSVTSQSLSSRFTMTSRPSA